MEHHGDSYDKDYLTDVLKRRALRFLQAQSASKPFMAWVATPAAHASFTPAPQYEGTAQGQQAPRTPTWNKVYADRHQTVRELSPMTEQEQEQSDVIFTQRLGTLRSVDDLVREVLDQLETQGLLNNTYVFYTGGAYLCARARACVCARLCGCGCVCGRSHTGTGTGKRSLLELASSHHHHHHAARAVPPSLPHTHPHTHKHTRSCTLIHLHLHDLMKPHGHPL